MPADRSVDIDMDRTCACGQKGVVAGPGVCLSCLTRRFTERRAMAHRIRKVKWDGKRVLIEHEFRNTRKEWDEYSMSCTEAPRPDLVAALDALVPYGREIAELPEDDDPQLRCTGLSCSWSGEDETMGAVIILRKKLRKTEGAVNLVTPYRKADNMDPKLVEAIEDVQAAAQDYLDGARAQTDLFKDRAAGA